MSPAERAALLERPLPARGASPESLLDQVGREILSHPMGNGHPRFFGWVNSPPAPIGVVAELLGAALNPSCAGGDHAAIYVERAAVRWLMELVGFPVEGSMGLLVSGGSMASLTCLAAARHRAAAADGWDVRARGVAGAPAPLVLYLSEEGHSCIRKAAEVLGLGRDAVRTVPVDERLPPGRGGAPRRRPRGPRGRAPALLRGGERGNGQHGRDRPARRGGRPLPGRGLVAPRRRRLRRGRRGGPGARASLRRARARGLARARPAQVALRAGGVRVRARPRRRDCSATRGAWFRRISGPRRARASGASPGTRSTGSSRRAASGPSSSG